MKELALYKVLIDENRHEQMIILKEKEGSRLLPIVIGIAEATSIRLQLKKFQPPRPLTHDLIMSLLEKLDVTLQQIVIDRLENNTFFAKLFLLQNGGNSIEVDARPSDSIALAIRCNAPVFVEEDVLERARLKEEL